MELRLVLKLSSTFDEESVEEEVGWTSAADENQRCHCVHQSHRNPEQGAQTSHHARVEVCFLKN